MSRKYRRANSGFSGEVVPELQLCPLEAISVGRNNAEARSAKTIPSATGARLDQGDSVLAGVIKIPSLQTREVGGFAHVQEALT